MEGGGEKEEEGERGEERGGWKREGEDRRGEGGKGVVR